MGGLSFSGLKIQKKALNVKIQYFFVRRFFMRTAYCNFAKKMNKCLLCGNDLSGRSDKKFCNDLCRSEYHNRKRKRENRKLSIYRKMLISNRKILMSHTSLGTGKVRKTVLVFQHFNFEIYTSSKPRFMRPTLYYCFNYEYFISRTGIVHIRDIYIQLNDYL